MDVKSVVLFFARAVARAVVMAQGDKGVPFLVVVVSPINDFMGNTNGRQSSTTHCLSRKAPNLLPQIHITFLTATIPLLPPKWPGRERTMVDNCNQ